MLLNNLFRTDLNLNSRWWHRLFLVVFAAAFLYALYFIWDTPLPKYAAIETLESRMGDELKLLPELVMPNEKIGRNEHNLHGGLYEKNEGWALRQPNIYCSNNITEHIGDISSMTGIALYKGNGAEELLTLKNFQNYLNVEGANCVYATSISDNKKVIGYAWFITDDLKVWRESIPASVIYILYNSLLATIPFLLLIILYYKVFLYVVFGGRKIETK